MSWDDFIDGHAVFVEDGEIVIFYQDYFILVGLDAEAFSLDGFGADLSKVLDL